MGDIGEEELYMVYRKEKDLFVFLCKDYTKDCVQKDKEELWWRLLKHAYTLASCCFISNAPELKHKALEAKVSPYFQRVAIFHDSFSTTDVKFWKALLIYSWWAKYINCYRHVLQSVIDSVIIPVNKF